MSGSARAVRLYRLAVVFMAVAALSAGVFLLLRATLPAPQRLESQPHAGGARRPAKRAESPTKKSRDEQAPVPLIARTPRGATAPPRGVVGTSKIDPPASRDRGRAEPAAIPHRELEALRDAPTAAAPSVLPSPPEPRPAPAPVPSEVPTGESIAVQQIQQVLTRYEQAYDRLDAGAAAAVWPSVDRNGLERAFARLRQQDLEFNRCAFGISSVDATVTCSGELRYVRRFGNTLPRVEPHSWIIQFRQVDGEWRIVSVVGR
jgi:hypothetical protein